MAGNPSIPSNGKKLRRPDLNDTTSGWPGANGNPQRSHYENGAIRDFLRDLTLSDIAISVEHLSKSYLVGHNAAKAERYLALRDVLTRNVHNLARKTRDMISGRPIVQGDEVEEFWALKDVSFEIKSGDRVGIIGRNGAGKSTLLKILSRITEPTKGRVKIAGRVASLLEVGTGFHPELTGHENIFLNGAILGMTRSEIQRKFDAIVAFADVEKFLDTPVKRYSSGMYVRLAFAVAAHLETEILVIDEVLAVGDAEFQKKCLGKIGEVAHGGRTVLLVTHNVGVVQELCNKVIWLNKGTVGGDGSSEEVTAKYLLDTHQDKNSQFAGPVRIDETLEFRRFDLMPNPVQSGACVDLSLEIFALQASKIQELAILIYSSLDIRIAIIDFRLSGLPVNLMEGQSLNMTCGIKSLPLVEGQYKLGCYIGSRGFCGNLFDLTELSVVPKVYRHGLLPFPAAHRGVLELECVGIHIEVASSQTFGK